MEKFLNLVRSNNMVQAVLCIAFGLFLMIYPSITVQGIILLFGVALAAMGAAGCFTGSGVLAYLKDAVCATAIRAPLCRRCSTSSSRSLRLSFRK